MFQITYPDGSTKKINDNDGITLRRHMTRNTQKRVFGNDNIMIFDDDVCLIETKHYYYSKSRHRFERKMHGEYIERYTNGQMKCHRVFDNGVLLTSTEWNDDGSMWRWKRRIMHNMVYEYKQYFQDGYVHCYYNDYGQLHGDYMSFRNGDGVVAHYEHGILTHSDDGSQTA